MKKITILLFCLLFLTAFSQSKSTGDISLSNGITANFTLNSTTAKVTLVLKGPSDRWFGLGLGVQRGFGMQNGDVLVYTTSLTDRNFVGYGSPESDNQDWATVSDPTPVAGLRTLTLERNLVNSETNDFQFSYDTTNSIDIVGVRANSNTTSLSGNHIYAFSSGTFSTVLGVEDFSLNATSIYPNPSNGSFSIETKTRLDKINVYSQTGAFVKTIEVTDMSNKVNLNLTNFQKGIYLIELQNENEKTWKKIIIE